MKHLKNFEELLTIKDRDNDNAFIFLRFRPGDHVQHKVFPTTFFEVIAVDPRTREYTLVDIKTGIEQYPRKLDGLWTLVPEYEVDANKYNL